MHIGEYIHILLKILTYAYRYKYAILLNTGGLILDKLYKLKHYRINTGRYVTTEVMRSHIILSDQKVRIS